MLRVDRVGYIEIRNPRSGAESLGRLGLGLWNQVGLCLVSSRVGSLPSLIYRVPELTEALAQAFLLSLVTSEGDSWTFF